MLILTDTDGFRVDFYKLGKRVLQSSGDGCRTSLSHIEVGEFLRCQFACGINGSTGLVYNHILHRLLQFLNHFHDNLLRLPGCGSVSDGNQGNTVFFNELLYFCLGFFYFVLGCCGIHHLSVQHLSGSIYDR